MWDVESILKLKGSTGKKEWKPVIWLMAKKVFVK